MNPEQLHGSAYRVLRRLSHDDHSGMLPGLVLQKGDTVYEYGGYTYECISAAGIAVTFQYDLPPFFEVPTDAIVAVEPRGNSDAL